MLQILDPCTPGPFLSWALSCQYVYFFLLEFINLQGFAGNILSVKTMFCQLIVKPSLLIHYAKLARVFQDEQSSALVAVTGYDVMCSSCPHRLSHIWVCSQGFCPLDIYTLTLDEVQLPVV